MSRLYDLQMATTILFPSTTYQADGRRNAQHHGART